MVKTCNGFIVIDFCDGTRARFTLEQGKGRRGRRRMMMRRRRRRRRRSGRRRRRKTSMLYTRQYQMGVGGKEQ